MTRTLDTFARPFLSMSVWGASDRARWHATPRAPGGPVAQSTGRMADPRRAAELDQSPTERTP